jgi:hypothetical protein
VVRRNLAAGRFYQCPRFHSPWNKRRRHWQNAALQLVAAKVLMFTLAKILLAARTTAPFSTGRLGRGVIRDAHTRASPRIWRALFDVK